MMGAAWTRYGFYFYNAVFSRHKGEFVWVKGPDLQTPTQRAQWVALTETRRLPVLQDFMKGMQQIKNEVPTENVGVT